MQPYPWSAAASSSPSLGRARARIARRTRRLLALGGLVFAALPAAALASEDGAPRPAAEPERAAAGSSGEDPAPPARERRATERLSRPGVLSRWAFVERPVTARRAPSAPARRVGRLGRRTEDGTDELVLVMARTVAADGRPWLQVRLPIRPVGSTGWIPQTAVGKLRRVRTWLQVDTRRLVAVLVKSRRPVFRAPVAVGQPRWPTPRGHFYIRNKFVGYPRGTIYGALAFGTSAKSKVLTDWPRGGIVGIHGTNRPELIPGRVSHGCVRMRDADIVRLERLMPVGTPLTIR